MPEPITPERVRELLDGATPGQWEGVPTPCWSICAADPEDSYSW